MICQMTIADIEAAEARSASPDVASLVKDHKALSNSLAECWTLLADLATEPSARPEMAIAATIERKRQVREFLAKQGVPGFA